MVCVIWRKGRFDEAFCDMLDNRVGIHLQRVDNESMYDMLNDSSLYVIKAAKGGDASTASTCTAI